ncbi:hypothetical protein F4692_000077 [Nocardioides cavernae]|uniref:Uncharacterized protein n=1 Tax=Nocardioides cavernae TaxID=1921566 RepID=A0A7Y9GZ51_9ACTN|nr:hypothetical protein [Nocardioides cavernae]
MTSSATETERERRAARRAALRAVHPDLGGDTEEFLAVMRAFESRPLGEGGSGTAPTRSTGLADGVGTATAAGPGTIARPVVTTTARSRAARRARRARRRLRAAAARGPLSWPRTRYAVLNGVATPSTSEERA